jgi:alpha-ketoglutarate-dependent taurine dioxygenase
MTPSNTSPKTQTILFLAANPNDNVNQLGQELREIEAGLQRAQRGYQFNLEQRSAVRPRDIQRAMLDVNPQIVHFSGRSEGETGLVFEDNIGNSQLVDGAALAALFELFANQLDCVVLNGCYSKVQAQAISQHIPFVIGMKKAITKQAANAFAVGFYDALVAGRDVEFAFRLGCTAIQLEGIAEHLTPVLLRRPTVVGDAVQVNQNSLDLEAYRIREYNPTIKYLINRAENSFDMILRSGKILFECFPDFEKALERGCSIRIIILNILNNSLIINMSYKSSDPLEKLRENFECGENAIKRLTNLSKNCDGKFDVKMCDHYLPSELVFLSTFSGKSKGFVFSIPLKFKQSPRTSPGILSSLENTSEIFKFYQHEFDSLWKYINSDKNFDANFDISKALLKIKNVCTMSEVDIFNMYEIFKKWGFVIIQPNEIKEEIEYFETELLELKKYFGNDFQHNRMRENGISTVALEPGFPGNFGTLNISTGLHTDGSYDELPPKVIIHQCVIPSEKDGETLLVSFKNIYRQLINNESTIKALSCDSRTFTIRSGSKSCTRSVFCGCKEDGRIRAAFRSCENRPLPGVFTTSPAGAMREAFNELDKIIHREENIFSFKLNKFDILILDNTSVLHGRSKFEDNSDRRLHRLMLDGEISDHKERLCFGFEL